MDEKWVLRSPEEMAEEVRACWTERFPMVMDDLQRLPAEGPVIAEGAGLFPRLVAPLLGEPANAVWLIPSPTLQRWVRDTRGRTVADAPHISDRQRAHENVIARDALLAAHIRAEAEALNLPVIPVERDDIVNVVDRVEPFLVPWLEAGRR